MRIGIRVRLILFVVLLSLLAAALLAACRPDAGAPAATSTPPAQAGMIAAISIPAESAPAAAYPADLATDWFDLQLMLIQETPGFTPPVAARALGYSGVVLYEVLVNGMPGHNSLTGQLNNLAFLPRPEAHASYYWPAAANSALATILRLLYPTATPENQAAIDNLAELNANHYTVAAGGEVYNRSAAYGQAVAEAVFAWSISDGGHEGYTRNFPEGFVPRAGPGLWVPTAPNFQAAMQPYWGQNRTFALDLGRECNVPPPPPFSVDPNSHFYGEAYEVYATVRNLTPEQEAIALFWADDPGQTFTPPGHSIAITTQVLRQEGATLDVAAESYARVGLAVADAFIGCWRAKYIYNLVRPITYIQTVIDPNWNTPDITDPVTTPPFPEYTSGHSVQSAATATVLTALFGENYAFTDNAHAARGLPARSYPSFDAYAEEAAVSRLYGGIHYRTAIEVGVEQGRCIGQQVNALAWRK
jgi:hypothetical protein